MVWAVILCLTAFRLWDSCTGLAIGAGTRKRAIGRQATCRPAVSEARWHPSLFGMAFSYSSSQLHKLNPAITSGLNNPIINELRILRRSRYVHRSTRRCFVHHQQAEQYIPSIWTPVAQLTRHQSAATKRQFHSKQDRKRRVDHSLLRPLQRHSVTVNPAPPHIHFMCLVETWQQPEVYSSLNEACPPGYTYLSKARTTGRGGGLAVVHGKSSRQISFRNLKNINPVTLTTDLRHLSAANPLSVTESVDLYNLSLSTLLDRHAPVKSRTVTFKRSAPWYTRELRLQKRTRRVLEQCFKDSGLAVHKLAYREHQRAYSKSLSDTRSWFYSHIINNSPADDTSRDMRERTCH
ncbi:unnamed protein product [Leuciscus chuanchicus]